MNSSHQMNLLALGLAAVAWLSPQDGPAPAKLGQPVPDHEFAPIEAHDGRASLSQLFGRPVVVAGWRQHIPEPSGLNAAWFANALMREFGEDGLIVVLEDRKPWTEQRWWTARSFWIRMFDHTAWFAAGEPGAVADLPIVREKSARDDHSLVLIGVDGRLLFEGRIEEAGENALGEEVRALVKEEIARRQKGWGEDRDLKKARALALGGGKLGGALSAVEKSQAPDEEKQRVRDEIQQVFDAELASVRFLLEQGRYFEAEARWEELRKGSRGHEPFLAAIDALEESFDDKESRKLAKQLEKIAGLMTFEDWRDLDLDALFELRALAAEHPDHPVGRRAARLDPLVKDLARISKGMLPKEMEEAIQKREEKELR